MSEISTDLIRQALLSPSAQRLGWALAHFLWQGAAIALLYGMAKPWLRRARSSTAYVFAALSLAVCAMVFLATLYHSSINRS